MTTPQNGQASSPKPVDHFIDGKFVPAAGGGRFDLRNPANAHVICAVARGGDEDVRQAIEAAKQATQGPWAALSAPERADLLDAIADGIEARSEELALLESQDSGKTLRMASTVDIPRAAANFRFYAGAVRHDTTGCYPMRDAINYTLRVPVGVCALITPWNLPLYLLSWKVAPALAMGNTVVVKPSELTPRTATVLADIIRTTPGFPHGVFNVVHGYGAEVGGPLVGHPDVNLVSFTGGTATGKIVARTASPMFKKLSLELGGKNPTVVFADADLDTAVAGALRSAFTNQGQVCLAGSRILVERPVFQRFLDEFCARAGKLRVGDPLEEGTEVGPVSSHAHRDKIEGYVAKAREQGATVHCGGARPDDEVLGALSAGAYYLPTVISGLAPDSEVIMEEIFGPVVTVQPFDSEDEAVALANCVQYGLAASVWTTNLGRAHRVAARIEAGIIWVNCWLLRDLRTAFGGVKQSGIGREGGQYSLEFYSEYKNVCIHTKAM